MTLSAVVTVTRMFPGMKSFAPVSISRASNGDTLNQDADGRCYPMEVFSCPPDALEPKVSGVGINHDPDHDFYTVPSNYDTRWDDEGYQFPATDELPLMRQRPWNGRHGFILHAVCYAFLQEFFYPGEVPVARLMEICKSFPFAGFGLDWGHDYGGSVCVRDQYPWDDQDLHIEQPELFQERRADPWNIPKLNELLQAAQLGSSKKQSVKSVKLTLTDGAALSNCFMRLPFEILERILTFLPTDEVRAFARTSKGLAMSIPSGLGQSFWASRFRPPFELDFVFEAQKYRDGLDWRWLYFAVVKAMGLQNRERIWGVIRSPLSELLDTRLSDSLALHPLDANEDLLRWKEVCGNLQPLEHVGGTSRFNTGCKRFHTQRTLIPTLLRQVAISTISIGNATYVTGVRFIPNEGSEVHVGYTAEGRKSFLNTADRFLAATGVRGFILAMGSRGIQALQIITCAGQLSQWFGCPDGLPRTRRLATSKSVVALEAGFDVSVNFFSVGTSY